MVHPLFCLKQLFNFFIFSIYIMPKFPYPENPALTDAPLLDAIKRRWSPVAFSDEPIEQEKIQAILEAMRWTQSSRNEQPWRLIYATQDDKEAFDNLTSILAEGNSYAKKAYMVGLICALPNHEYKNKPNRTHQYDTGAAMHSIFLQAVSMDLVAHEMSGFDIEGSHAVLGIPEEVVPMAMIAIGYPGDENQLSEDLKDRQEIGQRERKDLSEVVFKGKWQS